MRGRSEQLAGCCRGRWSSGAIPLACTILTLALPLPAPARGQTAGRGQRIAVVRQGGCCAGEAARLERELLSALERRPHMVVARGAPPVRSATAAELEARAREVRAALARGADRYQHMQMDDARQELVRALALARQSPGASFGAETLARIHLHLAAVSQSQGQVAQVRQHCAAVVRYAPALKPDPDLFAPRLREVVESARQRRVAVEVTILSDPPDAQVVWDGSRRGPTPLRLRDQSAGPHLLYLEAAGHRPWSNTVTLIPGVSAQLRMQLAAQSTTPQQPAGEGAVGVLLLRAEGEALRAELRGDRGTRAARLAPGSTSAAVEQAVVLLAGDGLLPPPPPTAPVDGPTPRRSVWRRYWWAWALVGVGVVAVSVAVPLAVHGDATPAGRGARLPLP